MNNKIINIFLLSALLVPIAKAANIDAQASKAEQCAEFCVHVDALDNNAEQPLTRRSCCGPMVPVCEEKSICKLKICKSLRVIGALVVDGSLVVNGVNFNSLIPLAALIGAVGATGSTGAAGAAGIAGIPGIQGIAGALGAIGLTGATGATGAAGTSAVSNFAMFFGLTSGTGQDPDPTNYPATIAVKTSAGTGRVPFPQSGPALGNITPDVGTSSFVLPSIGTYEITFRVHTTEPGQLQLELNGAAVASTVAVNQNPTSGGHPIIGNFFITTTSVNSVLAVINPTGNSTALTVTPPAAGGTHANSQSITIKQLA